MDRRLLGTWKSDRRRTFRHFRPRPGCDPATFRKFKTLFGHMQVRWTRTRCYWRDERFDKKWQSQTYEIVASDDVSVVVRVPEPILGEGWTLYQLHFEADCYWISLAPGLSEVFRRIK